MTWHFRLLTCFVTLAMFFSLSVEARALARHKQNARAEKVVTRAKHHRVAVLKKRAHVPHAVAARRKLALSGDLSLHNNAVPVPLSGDLATLKDALELVRKGKISEASAKEKTMGDSAVQRLVEWLILRHTAEADFSRYATFITDNPRWPSSGLMRRRAEARL